MLVLKLIWVLNLIFNIPIWNSRCCCRCCCCCLFHRGFCPPRKWPHTSVYRLKYLLRSCGPVQGEKWRRHRPRKFRIAKKNYKISLYVIYTYVTYTYKILNINVRICIRNMYRFIIYVYVFYTYFVYIYVYLYVYV